MNKKVSWLTAGATLFGIAVGVAAKPVRSPKVASFEVIRARRLELVDDQNVPRIILSQTQGKTVLAFECLDAKGKRYGDVVLGATPEEGQTLLFQNSARKSYAVIKVNKAGVPILQLRDPRGKTLDILVPK